MKFYSHSHVTIGTPDVFLVGENRIIYGIARKQVRRIVVRSMREKSSMGGAQKILQCGHEIVEGFAAVLEHTISSSIYWSLCVPQNFAPNCPLVRPLGP